MKLRILSLVLLGITSSNFCGIGWSSPSQGEKVRIASALTLEKMFSKKGLAVNNLKQAGLIAFFADKEFYQSELDSKIDECFEQFWKNTVCEQMKLQMEENAFKEKEAVQHANYLKQLNELKPHILEVLQAKPESEENTEEQ